MDPITNEEDVKYHLGRFYFQKKNYRKAIKIYEEGLAINPESVILLYEIGLTYLKISDRSHAEKYWKELLSLVSTHSFLANEVNWKLERNFE